MLTASKGNGYDAPYSEFEQQQLAKLIRKHTVSTGDGEFIITDLALFTHIM